MRTTVCAQKLVNITSQYNISLTTSFSKNACSKCFYFEYLTKTSSYKKENNTLVDVRSWYEKQWQNRCKLFWVKDHNALPYKRFTK